MLLQVLGVEGMSDDVGFLWLDTTKGPWKTSFK